MAENVIMLKDEIGTKYVIDQVTGRLLNAMEKAYNEGKTLDLAGTRFGLWAVTVMETSPYFMKINIINTEDPIANEVLRVNKEQKTKEYSEYPELSISTFETYNSVIDFILAHKNNIGEQFRLKIPTETRRALSMATLLIMALPNIEFDLRSCSTSLFKFVRDKWRIAAQHHDAYYENISPDVRVVRCKDGLYDGLPENTFVNTREVVPYEFGTEVLVSYDDGGYIASSEWESLCETLFEFLMDEDNNDKPSGRTLASYLTFRKE